jgi:hypothetical protein
MRLTITKQTGTTNGPLGDKREISWQSQLGANPFGEFRSDVIDGRGIDSAISDVSAANEWDASGTKLVIANSIAVRNQ